MNDHFGKRLNKAALPLYVLMFMFIATSSQAWTMRRISQDNSGIAGDLQSMNGQISGDGRYVLISSAASDLIPNDTNGYSDIFLYDLYACTIERVSVGNSGIQSVYGGSSPSTDYSGRYIAFDSRSSNLVPNDYNGVEDIFVYDRVAQTIECISLNGSGQTANYYSRYTSMSRDGRYVAFSSGASDLVPNDTNNRDDIFVYDRTLHTIERVSVDDYGVEGNDQSTHQCLSSDGRYVAFRSLAYNLVPGDTPGTLDTFIYDRTTHTIERITNDYAISFADQDCFDSSNNLFVLYTVEPLVPADTDNTPDVYVYNRTTHSYELISVNNAGIKGNEGSVYPSMSMDGRYVAYWSLADNLVSGDTNGYYDWFVYDRSTGTVERITPNNYGVRDMALGYNGPSDMNDDGRIVAIFSYTEFNIPNDVNDATDAYVIYRDIALCDDPTMTPTPDISVPTPTPTWGRNCPSAVYVSKNIYKPRMDADPLIIEVCHCYSGNYRVAIYNTAGELLRVLRNSRNQAPVHEQIEWDGKNMHNQHVSSGVYIIECIDGFDLHVKKVIVLNG